MTIPGESGVRENVMPGRLFLLQCGRVFVGCGEMLLGRRLLSSVTVTSEKSISNMDDDQMTLHYRDDISKSHHQHLIEHIVYDHALGSYCFAFRIGGFNGAKLTIQPRMTLAPMRVCNVNSV